MAIGISFDKAKAKVFLDCLANGKPVPPQDPRGWTVYDMLALAGACYFAGMSHGPALYQNTDWSKVPGERHKAVVLPGEGEGKQVIPIEGFRKTA